jgi:hypothetical protein
MQDQKQQQQHTHVQYTVEEEGQEPKFKGPVPTALLLMLAASYLQTNKIRVLPNTIP